MDSSTSHGQEVEQNKISAFSSINESTTNALEPNQFRMIVRGRFLADSDQWESKASARYFGVEYTAQNHDLNGGFNFSTSASNENEPDLERKVRMRPFEPVQDIILKRINVVTNGLPTDVFEAVLGDTCLYSIGSNVFEPMPDGTHCTATRTVSPPGKPVKSGYIRNMIFPGDTGLFVPAGSRLNCPVHLAVGAGQTLSQNHVKNAEVSCAFIYELAGPNVTVQKFLRIPYLDEFGNTPTLIAPNHPWYKAWSNTEPLVVRGLSMYWGPRITAAESFGPNQVCVYAINTATRQPVPNKALCMPAQTIPAGTTFNLFNPSVVVDTPFEVGAGEHLSARCIVNSPRAKADCIVYPLVDVPLARRNSVRLAPIWNNPGYVSTGFVRNTYCPKLMNLDPGGITPAMLRILDSLVGSTIAPWNSITIWPDDERERRRMACTHLFDGY